MLVALAACHSDDDDGNVTPVTPAESGAPFELMIVFAPGQLGDNGYADGILNVANIFNSSDQKNADNDSLDVHFLSDEYYTDTREDIQTWAANPANPIYDATYERRLLVLTEPVMIPWLDDIKGTLRPTDEVLLLKVSDDDVADAEQRYGLEGRIHGVNIPVGKAVRRFMQYLSEMGELPAEPDPDNDILPIIRLYPESAVTPRDSVVEAITDYLGRNDLITTAGALISKGDEYKVITGTTGIDYAYYIARYFDETEDLAPMGAVIDLGSFNAGWDYYLMSKIDGKNDNNKYYTLVIDGNTIIMNNRSYVKRQYDAVMVKFLLAWMSSDAATMPRFQSFTDYYYDDIPIYDYDYE